MELQIMPPRFRVWDKNYKMFIEKDDWSYRHLCIKPNGKVCEVDAYIEYGGTQSECTIIEYEDISDGVIISQDTGIKDKNGNSIFTGDIIRNEDGIGVVQYESPSIVIRYHPKYCSQFITGEVVGNIWQNPELLEEK